MGRFQGGGLMDLMGVVLRRRRGWGLWGWAWVMREKGLGLGEEGGRGRRRGKGRIQRLACERRRKGNETGGPVGEGRVRLLKSFYSFLYLLFMCKLQQQHQHQTLCQHGTHLLHKISLTVLGL